MLRVRGLLSYGLQVPALEAAQEFHGAFGLQVLDRGGGCAVVRCDGREQDQAVLVEGPVKRLHHVAFAVDPGSLPEWRVRLTALGVGLVDGPAEVPGGLWLRDHEGNLIALRDEEPAAWRGFAGADLRRPNFGDRVERVGSARWRTADAAPRPRRLGHVLVFSTDLAASERFGAQVLGLRVSDRARGVATFMNCGPGDHHVYGFVRGPRPGLHHSSWEVADLDEMVVGARSMADAGYRQGWGLGRHTLGSNLFHYVQDPWGSWIEYFTDMDRITEGWRAGDWDCPPYVWGPRMPADFLVNREGVG